MRYAKILILPLLVVPVFPELRTVESVGIAVIDNNVTDAKRRSLIDAQRTAVEKAKGLWLEARATVDKHVMTENVVTTSVAGYIQEYTVLSEIVQGGACLTRIKAVVDLSAVDSPSSVARTVSQQIYCAQVAQWDQASMDYSNGHISLNQFDRITGGRRTWTPCTQEGL